MCGFDVESLYTNVTINEAIEITLDFTYKPRKIVDVPFNRDQFRKLLIFSLKNAHSRFLDKVCQQINGVAIGNPLAPIIADLWIQNMEQKLNKFSTNKPIIWLRYVDDVYCLSTVAKHKILELHSRINIWHKNLHFTIRFESNNSISFLDVLVTREENQLVTSIYRKSTHTGLYMLWDSCQNRRYKLGLIKALVIRIYRICSTQKIINYELNNLISTLKQNGYPLHIIKRGISEARAIEKRRRDTKTNSKKKTDNGKTNHFTFGYYGYESRIFTAGIRNIYGKLLPDRKTRFAFKKHISLKSIFLPILKSRDEDKHKKNLIYSIPCSDCNKVYIGETAKMEDTRINEHKPKIKALSSDSKHVEHFLKHNHNFDFTNTKTFALESN